MTAFFPTKPAGRLTAALLIFSLLMLPPAWAQQTAAPATQDAPKELSLKVTDAISLKTVLIPAGKFVMGSPKSDPYRYYDECPQHEVTLTKSFYMGIYDVTQEQFEAVMGKNPSPTKGPTNPVENVTWADSVGFCQKLSQRTGQTVRLPTEAEWEYACRAGTTTRFSFGDDETQLGDYGWYRDNSGHQSHPVGQKKPNPWGLYDMHGNVWQWCSTTRSIVDSYRSADPVTDPPDPEVQSGSRGAAANHILRGGSWVYPAQKCRSATRGFDGTGPWYEGYGFRVVVEAKQSL